MLKNNTIFEIILYSVFFLSGGSAILYQMVWHRVLYASFGINIEAVTIIVSVFMFGLGVGALFGGYLTRTKKYNYIYYFIFFEILIGLFGLVSISLIKWVAYFFLSFSIIVLPLAIFILVCVPTVCMGATLPILVSYLTQYKKNTGQVVSNLYGINTFGSAVFSILLTAYKLISGFDLSDVNILICPNPKILNQKGLSIL